MHRRWSHRPVRTLHYISSAVMGILPSYDDVSSMGIAQLKPSRQLRIGKRSTPDRVNLAGHTTLAAHYRRLNHALCHVGIMFTVQNRIHRNAWQNLRDCSDWRQVSTVRPLIAPGRPQTMMPRRTWRRTRTIPHRCRFDLMQGPQHGEDGPFFTALSIYKPLSLVQRFPVAAVEH